MQKTLTFVLFLSLSHGAIAQQAVIDSSKYPPLKTMTAIQDQANMMQQVGIKKLRPGPSGNESESNHANYDEAMADPCPQLPDVLTTKTGKKVTTPDQWWTLRRPELIEDFEREMYGRVPKNMPKVTWTAKVTDNEVVGRIPVLARHFIGRVDNSEYPLISVNINMVLVLPQNVKGPVPVMMMFGFLPPTLPAPAQPSPADLEKINTAFKDLMIRNNPELKAIFDKYPAYSPITRLPGPNFFAPAPNGDSPPTEQLLAAGWGYCTLETGSIQADNGAGLTRGIIGLVNKGQPRKSDDWGCFTSLGLGSLASAGLSGDGPTGKCQTSWD